MMALPEHRRNALQEKIDDLLDGDLPENDRRALAQQIESDPQVAAFYAEHVALHADLRWEHATDLASATAAPTMPLRITAHGAWAAAAALALALGLGWLLQPNPRPQAAARAAGVARVAWVENAQWQADGGTAPLGAWLKPGRVQVQRGRLALAFDSGAEVILEGPCVFELTGSNGGKLQRGSLSSHVPPEAVGFRVETPRSNIVDRGTDFAVVVGDDGGTEVHVVKGLVDVAPVDGSSVVSVRTAEAVRVMSDAARRVGFSDERFRSPTALNLSRPARAVHWSFDAPEPFADRGGTLSGGPYPVRFQHGTPESIKGPFGQALRLDGTNRHGVTDFRGIGGHAPRTIAFWVRIPRDAAGAHAYSVLAWGRAFPRKGNKWQIAWNRHPGNGKPGALRTEFGGGYAIGSTDLRDGKWHHITSVWMGGKDADVATHMRLYVDGKLETLTGTLREKVRTLTGGKKVHTVKLGANINSWKVHEFFRGDLDEIWVFDRALLPREIHALMATNQPPPHPGD